VRIFLFVGCLLSSSVALAQVTATITSQTNVSCNGGSNGSATATGSGGTAPYSYSWAPGGSTTATVSGLSAGAYTVTVTDATLATATATATITQPTAISVTPASQTNVACNGGSSGAASINTPTGGAGGYTYNWTPGNPTGDGTVSVTGLSAGSWSANVTDANGCVATRTFNITQPTAINVTPASQTNISCNGGSNGAASINTPTGGAGGYTYNWTPGNPTGDGTVSVSGLTAGTWTATVTDANSCTRTQTFNVTQPTALTVTPASQTNISCSGGSNGAASINTPTGGAGGYTYNWTPGNPTGDGTVFVTGLTAGVWTATVTDANSCTRTQTFNVTQPPPLTVTPASQTNISCFGGTNGAASINTPTGGAGGYTYNWTPGNPTGDGTVSVTGLTATTWTVNVTDANSCTASQTFAVTQPSPIVVTPASQTNVSCNGGSNGAASINTPTGGAGGFTYNWTPGNPTGDGTVSVNGLTSGTWTATVTDANSCTATQTFSVTQPSAIVVTAASQTNVSCNGGSNGSASLNPATGGAGGFTYDWAPGNPAGDGTVSVSGLSAGVFTATVTDANSCTASRTFNVVQPPAITVSQASQTNVSCNGGSNGAASITTPTGGVGGFSYNWAPGNPVGDGTVSVVGLSAGTWTATVTDANACTASQTFSVTQPTPIVVTPAAQTNVSCNAGSNGAASINTPTGGVGGFTYNWTPGNPTGDGTVSVSGLSSGVFTATVTDANSCTATQTFSVTQPTALTVAPAAQLDVSCNGGSNGAASVLASGGAGGYTYDWAPGTPSGDGSESVSNLAANTWTATVTDANSCTTTQTFAITQPAAIDLSLSASTDAMCAGQDNGTAQINPATGGAGGFNYDWAPGAPSGDGTLTVSALAPGTYTVTATDAASCSQSLTVAIGTQYTLVATPTQSDVLCAGQTNGTAGVAVSGGVEPYAYDWGPGAPSGDGNADITGLGAGSFTVTVTDANSCLTTATVSISEPAPLVANGSSQGVSSKDICDGSAAVAPSGGVGPYSIAWAPQMLTTSSIAQQCEGATTATISDANGCVASFTADFAAASADLSVVLSGPTTAVIAGQTADLTVRLASASDVNGATVSVPIPAQLEVLSVTAPAGWVCSALPLTSAMLSCSTTSTVTAAGIDLVISVRVAELMGHGTVTIAASGSAPYNDPVATNNTASFSLDVISPAKLVALKTVEQKSPDVLRYTITVRNDGPAAALDIVDSDELDDVLPAGLTLVSATAATGTIVTTPTGFKWNGVLRANESVVVTLDATLDAMVAKGTSIENQASVRYDRNGDGMPDSVDGSSPNVSASGATTIIIERETPAGTDETPSPQGPKRGCGSCNSAADPSLLVGVLFMVLVLRRKPRRAA
jgi:uncharacterized repeat protein (TIGR01451 family)